MIVTEVELGKIAVQVLFTAMLIDTFHPAFEDAEVTLQRVHMGFATRILAGEVIDHLMVGGAEPALHVLLSGIGHQPRFVRDVPADHVFNGGARHLIEHDGAHFAPALDKAHDLHFGGRSRHPSARRPSCCR